MKTLLIMRHAKSSWSNGHLSDHDRPLNGRGIASAPRIGTMLRDLGLIPDTMLASTANRAHSTAVLVAEACGYTNEIAVEGSLYHGTPTDYLAQLARLSDEYECPLLVGHNPCLEDLIFMLTGLVEEMPTAAVAYIELPIEQWQQLSPKTQGTLLNVWRPKEIEA
jgi:phosphohistidine phosphatase